MPREGVPYPERMLCSLKCELKNIWNALNGKLHSVNGVEGDGQGNVTIVSENAALEVHDYPLQNQIGISLDTSQLPAAAVSSVNGETGAVVLDASEIRTSNNSDVDSDLAYIYNRGESTRGMVVQETTDRQNADSALQTNINAVTASLPGVAATAVANSPVVQSNTARIVALETADTLDLKTYGNQTASGIKQFVNPIGGGFIVTNGNLIDTVNYVKIASLKAFSQMHIRVYGMTPNNGFGYAEFLIGGSDQYNRSYMLFKKGIFNNASFARIGEGNYNNLWVKLDAPSSASIRVIIYNTTITLTADNNIYDTTLSNLPSVGDTDPITGNAITGVSLIS